MTQKELKAMYKANVMMHDNEKWATWLTNNAGYFIEHNSVIYTIEKPKIKTTFCFGYGCYGISTIEDIKNAYDCADVAKTSEQHFIDSNLEDLNRQIGLLKNLLHEMSFNWADGNAPRNMIRTGKYYNGSSVGTWGWVENNYRQNDDIVIWDVEFITKLIDGYEAVKVDFTKRLQAYLKRYGLSKVNAFTYLCD